MTALRRQMLQEFTAWFTAAGGSMEDVMGTGTGDDEEAEMDYGEQFERMEADRVLADDPDSLPFFKAQKAMRSTLVKGGKAKQAMLVRQKRLKK